ncbi:MAG: TraR/DksA family transcriptional regulator [Gammaproteobacteria bacterium]|nr:TraR/DksA family transcriptional regulator [Gammaproteobacteria bacterium]
MDQHEVGKLRDRLQALGRQLGEELRAGLEAGTTVELDQSRVGRLSRMDAIQAQAMSQEISRRLQARLGQIELALVRLQAGDYGYCDDCGEPIDPRRLEIDLLATRCISCASRNEL